MIRHDHIINSIAHGDAIEKLADAKSIDILEARQEFSKMGFLDYHNLINEAGTAIVPPSGQTIAPSANTVGQQKPAAATKAPQQIKSIWPGQGAPVKVGMTVGLTGPTGTPVPGEVSQVDMSANGVKVKNPTTGKDEWMNTDSLEQFVGAENTGSPQQANDLQRLRELAGIAENCSSGATGAGAIAMSAAPMGKVKRRNSAEESLEYTPDGPAKTVIGDTKPNQASGELSANLAARGKKTASRLNNGRKR